ncbi:MAG: transglutaminase domain-containing protein, partial [Planctomycetota bacterium]
MKADGVDLDQLSDKETVETAAQWLLDRAEYHNDFTCFSTAFDKDGQPFLPGKDASGTDVTKASEAWEKEISAAGMFRHKARGACSSSSIYLSGCLRAIGIPTRTVLCIPLIDANKPNQLEMVRRMKQPSVRQQLLEAFEPLKGKWASHTFNEVYIGGRWRRLNYSRLGQNTYDPNMMGLMTHVATFHDWSDAKMAETIGRRQAPGYEDYFDSPNPYKTLAIRDQVGKHCTLSLPDKPNSIF